MTIKTTIAIMLLSLLMASQAKAEDILYKLSVYDSQGLLYVGFYSSEDKCLEAGKPYTNWSCKPVVRVEK